MKNKILGLAVAAFLMSALCPGFAQESASSGKISLDIKGMDIVDVLKMLSTKTNMNLVVGKNVTGRVTLFLKEVDAWDAFDIVLLANELAADKQGDIINVMTQRDYELLYGQRYQDKKEVKIIALKYAKAADLARALTQIKTNIGRVVVDEGSNTLALIDNPDKIREMEDFIKKTDMPLETRVFKLKYAQADKLSVKIKEELSKPAGTLNIDERTNKLVVTDYPERLAGISRVIQAFDEKSGQVLIDAQVIEIKPSDKFQMGVDWDFWLKNNVRLIGTLATSGAISTLSLGEAAKSALVTKPGEYKTIIDLLRTIGDTKILSSPRITALNNQEAKILVGTKDAYITSTVSQSGTGTAITSQTVNFVDVGIKLYVTPTINQDGFVTMKIRPEISSSERRQIISQGLLTEVPIVTTSEAETAVTIKDGVTLIIGGLRKDQRQKTVKKIPVLGDIPLFGYLFQNISDDLQITELVILLTPHIISGETALADLDELKPVDGAVAKMVDGQVIIEKFPSGTGKEKSAILASKSSYFTMVFYRVKQYAQVSAPKGKKGLVEINFSLSSSGSLLGNPKVINSTDPYLTLYAVNAVKDSAPFPPFPAELDKPRESFNITLAY